MFDRNSSIHLVGVGGIGMSGLAQLLRALGCRVSGSDRDMSSPENLRLFGLLEQQGITIFPQDGSFARAVRPDCVVYSTAVEEGNPDFAAIPDVPRIHRAAALERAIGLYAADGVTVAVSGSAGKTSVTSYLAEMLNLAGIDAGCLDGGMVRAFAAGVFPGNFHPGRRYFVFEADESDKSLLDYSVDYAIILNIGCDHYDEKELARVFGEFLRRVRKGVVLSDRVFAALSGMIPSGLTVRTLSEQRSPEQGSADYYVSAYGLSSGRAFAAVNNGATFELPQPGVHTALNMTAVAAMLEMVGMDWNKLALLTGRVRGAARRFEFVGRCGGAAVYDDYAHNPQKLGCCLTTAQSLTPGGRVFMVWQPHGYRPLGFMSAELGAMLRETLRPQDVFMLLEPFYAGGSSSFSPHSADVAAGWGIANVIAPADRKAVESYVSSRLAAGDILLICGARDNSLPRWAGEFTGRKQ